MGVLETNSTLGDIDSAVMNGILAQSLPLKIIIVGAGIGGLSAALGLRRNGHEVHIYEQSRFVNEVGAAVHLAPNANGILRKWGIFAETFGANPMDRLVERASDGRLRKDIDLRMPNRRWQHPWHLVHRVNLHHRLKQLATSETGVGTPATLHTASKIVALDPECGSLTLQDGSTVTGDLIIGADGIYSTTRKYIKDTKLFSTGKAAFRFLIPRRVAEADPVTAPLVEHKNALSMWFGDDRRIVMYPCNDNQLLNIVCIHPESESHATERDEWNKQGSIEQVLKIYQNFDPALKALMGKVDPAAVQVWQLLDMTKLPTWISGKLVLLGDAAHPFTPHQGQGAAQAIEDAAALTVVLPKGTTPDDMSECLQLYEEIRYERTHAIQEYSRLAGADWENGVPPVDMMAYTNYNFGHDALDHARKIFQRHCWSKCDPWPHLPTPFGPFPPQNAPKSTGYHLFSLPHESHHDCPTLTTTATVRFKTSHTFLETLFPTNELRFRQPDTVVTASLAAKRFSYRDGRKSSQIGCYIHGVQATMPDHSHRDGVYLPLMLANATDSSTSSCGPIAKCDVSLECSFETRECRVIASSGGISFVELTLSGLAERDIQLAPDGNVAEQRGEDVLIYSPQHWRGEDQDACLRNLTVSGRKKLGVAESGKGVEMKMEARSWEELPGLHHIAAVLAEIPVYEVLDGIVEEVERDVR
ncbi:hypothetical protein B0T16DRAFT_425591 [Cercophora newfieldiana]|uniref:FAD-binding domain-containing protein n=1 Tax=Cercophora newfieldiana TaxID=92897 RepID=A0AA39YRJ4_9PEZI|nr:hypothetical protein B0T16DRAFT_425591 [Cercophora newfieldiana]